MERLLILHNIITAVDLRDKLRGTLLSETMVINLPHKCYSLEQPEREVVG